MKALQRIDLVVPSEQYLYESMHGATILRHQRLHGATIIGCIYSKLPVNAFVMLVTSNNVRSNHYMFAGFLAFASKLQTASNIILVYKLVFIVTCSEHKTMQGAAVIGRHARSLKLCTAQPLLADMLGA